MDGVTAMRVPKSAGCCMQQPLLALLAGVLRLRVLFALCSLPLCRWLLFTALLYACTHHGASLYAALQGGRLTWMSLRWDRVPNSMPPSIEFLAQDVLLYIEASRTYVCTHVFQGACGFVYCLIAHAHASFGRPCVLEGSARRTPCQASALCGLRGPVSCAPQPQQPSTSLLTNTPLARGATCALHPKEHPPYTT